MLDHEEPAEDGWLQPSGRKRRPALALGSGHGATSLVAGLVQSRGAMVAALDPPLVLALPARARIGTFADGCRAAALEFVNRVAWRGMDKEAIASWLRGPYCAHVFAPARAVVPRIHARPVATGALGRLVAVARTEAIRAFEQARDDGPSFGFGALASGMVYRCQDVTGAQGWIPVSYPRMRLADRIVSLVAADYLLRSEDYESQVFSCSACRAVVFDAIARERGTCRAHATRLAS